MGLPRGAVMTYQQAQEELNRRGYMQVGSVWFSRTGLRYYFREAMQRCGLVDFEAALAN